MKDKQITRQVIPRIEYLRVKNYRALNDLELKKITPLTAFLGPNENVWETMERILQRAGYYPGGLPKKEVARNISENMDPMQNRSKSFQVFPDTLMKICPKEVTETI